jgi:hypothetical protein
MHPAQAPIAKVRLNEYTNVSANAYPDLPPSWTAATRGPFSVVINMQGTFYTATQGTFALTGGATLVVSGRAGFDAFVLLHELGHQLDDYTHFVDDSSGSNDTEGPNNQFVYQNCFLP